MIVNNPNPVPINEIFGDYFMLKSGNRYWNGHSWEPDTLHAVVFPDRMFEGVRREIEQRTGVTPRAVRAIPEKDSRK